MIKLRKLNDNQLTHLASIFRIANRNEGRRAHIRNNIDREMKKRKLIIPPLPL